ncbi:MAG: hypothetical protein ACPLRM_07565, partial [Anaerolineae bacterium]
LVLRFCAFLGLDPTTSAMVLATVGFMSMLAAAMALLARGVTSAGEGLERILEGLRRLLIGLLLGTALLIALALYCLTRGTLTHIQH